MARKRDGSLEGKKAAWERAESTWEYRVVQSPDRSITVYAELSPAEEEAVRREFQKLIRDRELVLPEICFAPYDWEVGKKLKRIQRIQASETKNRDL